METTGAGRVVPTRDAENAPARPSPAPSAPEAPTRRVQPADATGPLPVTFAVNATGPLPIAVQVDPASEVAEPAPDAAAVESAPAEAAPHDAVPAGTTPGEAGPVGAIPAEAAPDEVHTPETGTPETVPESAAAEAPSATRVTGFPAAAPPTAPMPVAPPTAATDVLQVPDSPVTAPLPVTHGVPETTGPADALAPAPVDSAPADTGPTNAGPTNAAEPTTILPAVPHVPVPGSLFDPGPNTGPTAPAAPLFDPGPPASGGHPGQSLFEPGPPLRPDMGPPVRNGNLFDAGPPAAPAGHPTEVTGPISPAAANAAALGRAAPSTPSPNSAGPGSAGPSTAGPGAAALDAAGMNAPTGPAPVVAPAGDLAPTPPGAPPPGAPAPGTLPRRQPGPPAWSAAPPTAVPAAMSAPTITPNREATPAPATPPGPPDDGGSPPGAPAERRRHRAPRRRARWPLAVLAVLVASAAGIALAVTFVRDPTSELIAAAATDASGWHGTHLRGAVPALDGGEIQVDLSVTRTGATGTLTRDDGQATAQIFRDSSGTLLKANRNWWLHHHPNRANDLADTWVADPLTEVREVAPLLGLHPQAMAVAVRPNQQIDEWSVVGNQQVDGQDGLVLSDGDRKMVVAEAAPHSVLGLDLDTAAGRAPIQVGGLPQPDADAASAAVTGARAGQPPEPLVQRLQERPVVAIGLAPEPLCATENCTVTVTVTNSGTMPARGRLEISADGKVVSTQPLDVAPGQVATFTAAAPNPQFATPGATGQILWESRAVDG